MIPMAPIDISPYPELRLMLHAIWAGMAMGVLSGALIGMFFAREDLMGGYNSWRRRLTRLGHISFFGLALVNATFVLTRMLVPVDPGMARLAAMCFLVGAASMPTVCFLSAWKQPFRHLFFVPVGGVAIGIFVVLSALLKH